MFINVLIILAISLVTVLLLNRITDSFRFSREVLKSFNLYDQKTSIRLAIDEVLQVVIYVIAPVSVLVFALVSFGWTL